MLDMELLISAPSMLKVYSLGVIPLSSVYFTLVSGCPAGPGVPLVIVIVPQVNLFIVIMLLYLVYLW